MKYKFNLHESSSSGETKTKIYKQKKILLEISIKGKMKYLLN